MDKRQLTRIVRTDDGVIIDPSGKANGRGAYLCANPVCWEKAIQHNRLESSLNVELSAPEKAAILAFKPSAQTE